MFDNPLESFHDMVAEAKDEREQLDRLLTISTPRERLLLAAVAVFLLILCAWLLFGSIDRSITLDGVLVKQDETLAEGSLSALVWTRGNGAPPIEVGMPVAVELDAKAGALGGAIRAVSVMPFAPGAPATFISLRRVDIALEEALGPDVFAGRQCRLVIGLGRQSPLELFLAKR